MQVIRWLPTRPHELQITQIKQIKQIIYISALKYLDHAKGIDGLYFHVLRTSPPPPPNRRRCQEENR